MADVQGLQDKINKFQIKVISEDLGEAINSSGVEINKQLNVKVVRQPKIHKVVIPEEMNKLQAAYNLLRQFEEEETFRNYNRSYQHLFLNDFLIATQELIHKYFGGLHVSKIDTQGKKADPDYIQIPLEFVKDELVSEKGFIGSIKCPCWEECIMDIGPGTVVIRSKLRFEEGVNQFLSEIEEYVKRASVVTGKPFTIKKLRIGLMAEPINPKINRKVILDENTERIVSNLLIPALQDKAKTSILFTGDYGTGKTETAIRLGVEGMHKHGRTFFYIHDATQLPDLIPYLKNYQHSIVFSEDLDAISAGDRTLDMNELLNQIDGNELKNVDCCFIFTTNNHDKIHPAMRRPGRIDQIVHFELCDEIMVEKIYRTYAEGYGASDEVNYKLAAQKTPERLQGAIVAEIAKRAIKYAEKLNNGMVSTGVFLDAIASLKPHIQFMKKDQIRDHSAENVLGHLLHIGLKKAFPNLADANIVIPGMPAGSTNAFQDSPYKDLNN